MLCIVYTCTLHISVPFLFIIIILQEYLHSEGIELNCREEAPPDPYTMSRNAPFHVFKTPSNYDNLKQFLEMDRKVLRFFCVWDDRDSMFGEIRPYVS